jgi:hypothetical protein
MTIQAPIVATTSFSWLALAFLAGACGSPAADGDPLFDAGDSTPPTTETPGSPSAGGIDSRPMIGGSGVLDPQASEAPSDPGACASVRAEAEVIATPVDIVVLLDNSGSMSDEARSVEANINDNFATILENSGVDYRVILVSRHRDSDRLTSNTDVCIASPLSGLGQCPAPAPVEGARFFQYSVGVGSRDSLELVLDTYDGAEPDDFELAPNGWSEWLRPGAKKVFLEITDDDSRLSAAEFITQLGALAPDNFGTASAPSFVWHSIVGLAEKGVPTEAYLASDPVEDGECAGNDNDVSNAGETYQELSQQTGGLRFPICQFQAYDTVFQTIASDLVNVSAVACDFALPAPPAGRTLELDKVAVSYTPGGGGAPRVLGQAPDAAACQPDAFVMDGTGIRLCPQACDTVRADRGASLDVLFTCDSTLR